MPAQAVAGKQASCVGLKLFAELMYITSLTSRGEASILCRIETPFSKLIEMVTADVAGKQASCVGLKLAGRHSRRREDDVAGKQASCVGLKPLIGPPMTLKMRGRG